MARRKRVTSDINRVLVTGGTGYLGSWCVATLLERGYRVVTSVRSANKADAVRRAVSSVTDPGDALDFAVANLTSASGWDEAMTDVQAVLHVASPLGASGRANVDLIGPAVDGTLHVLGAAARAGVRRVVLTSSGAAATPVPTGDVVIDDALWTDPDEPGLTAYRKSKVLAERAAWDFAASHPRLQLVTVLPGAIFGPALPGVSRSSLQIIARMLEGSLPAVPQVEMAVVDVRDLADLHVRALTSAKAAGQRFLAMGEVMTMGEIAAALRGLSLGAGRVSTRGMPDPLLRLLARFIPELRPLVPMLGRHITADSWRAREVLGWQPRSAAETIADSARSLLAKQNVRS